MPDAKGQKAPDPAAPGVRILHVRPGFERMPVNFIPNRGQMDERVAYYIQGKNKTIFFGAEGMTFILTEGDAEYMFGDPNNQESGEDVHPDRMASPAHLKAVRMTEDPSWVVKLDFLGANPGVKPVGQNETGAIISYFNGRPENWKSGLPTYSRILYPNLWPGIDLVYSGTMDALKHEFIVHPGANPSQIRLAYRGASSVHVNSTGSLVVSTPSGGFEDGVPVAYQEHCGKRMNVPLAYKVADGTKEQPLKNSFLENQDDGVTYSFSIGEYDRTKLLILDPVILIYCGFVGGPSYDYGYGIAADSSGHAYITGYTYSLGTAFPALVGPDLTYNGGSVDAFVAKLNASGTALEYCGYIGGSRDDFGYGIAVDSLGNAYVTGYTSSTNSTFPVSRGPDLTQNGLFDVFVAKVNPNGTALDYCGYIGGSDNDYGRSIAVDESGSAYITGYTSSNETSFPVSIGPDLTQNGSTDAFVAKVNPNGKKLDYCGYIGGIGDDFGYGIAVDISGNAYVTGCTNSTEATFPVLGGPYLVHSGYLDAFAAKVNPQGAELAYCGYIGGSGYDYGRGIAVDASGCAYITGYTSSGGDTFPATTGPYLAHGGGMYDAFVAKVEAEGGWLVYCGYIGGSEYDAGTAITVDGWGCAYIAGYTSSREDSFAVSVGPNLTNSGSFDVFVAKTDSSGKELQFCGYIGGTNADLGMGIALDKDRSGNIFLTGNTYSTESTFPVIEGPDLLQNGSRDGFVAKIYENSLALLAPNGGESWHVGFNKDITWQWTGQVGNVRIEFSTDNGESWTDIATSTANDGAFTWRVPDAVSDSCLVRISEADDGDPSDTSKAVFSITNEPILVVVAPNGGESWQVGSTHDITWLSGGEVGDVKIEYSTDDGLNWTEIEASTENDGTYTWTVPDTVSSECLVRISEAEDGDPLDTSDDVFSIVAPAKQNRRMLPQDAYQPDDHRTREKEFTRLGLRGPIQGGRN
jgi:hypothetical protein